MNYLKRCEDMTCGNVYPGDITVCPKCKSPDAFSSKEPVNPRDYVYDIETFPNVFTCAFIHIDTDQRWTFEISDRINQAVEFAAFVTWLGNSACRGVGYNNVGFDYPVVHYIMKNQWVVAAEIYEFAMILIKGTKDEKFERMVWDNDRIFEQIDLIMIWHYNKSNEATGTEPTSLKALEIAMRMDNVSDMPVELGTMLNDNEKDILHAYNMDDCIATAYFYARSLTAIKLREELSVTFNKNFINMSNTKMGGEILMIECEKSGIQFFEKINGRRQKRQTIRPSITLSECVFPYVKFEHPEFERIRQYFMGKIITETKGVFKGLCANVDGIGYHFGTGGIHASVVNKVFASNETHQIIDVDVASFYPNLAIVNKLHADHLGVEFCGAYNGVYHTRKTYAKGTPENAAYKEALNANYGNSNNKFSVFLDPKFTMSITLNGQLLLCMLVEQMIKIPGLEMIQANTDGITYYCPREYIEHTRALCKWWEQLTHLELEEALYSRMFVPNVNSYIAEYEGGAVKRIGAYAHERMDDNPGTREVPYGKDPSALVIPKAAEAALIHGTDIREFIENHDDDYDFMLRAKVPRSNSLVMRWPEYDNVEIPLANIIRYYVSNNGGTLTKVAPPTGQLGTWKRATKVPDALYLQVVAEITHDCEVYISAGGVGHYVVIDGQSIAVDALGIPHDERIHTKNRSKHGIREMGICVGWRVTDCSDVKCFNRSTLNYDYYVSEAEKLVKPLLT